MAFDRAKETLETGKESALSKTAQFVNPIVQKIAEVCRTYEKDQVPVNLFSQVNEFIDSQEDPTSSKGIDLKTSIQGAKSEMYTKLREVILDPKNKIYQQFINEEADRIMAQQSPNQQIG